MASVACRGLAWPCLTTPANHCRYPFGTAMPLKRPWRYDTARDAGRVDKRGTTADLQRQTRTRHLPLDVLESRSMSCGVQKAAAENNPSETEG